MDPANVFLDTNAFYKARFAFRGSYLESLSKRCSSGDVRLLMNDIVYREAKSYIANDILEIARKARNVINKDQVLGRALPEDIKKNIEKQILVIPELIGRYLDEFIQQAEMIPYGDMSVERLFDDYFSFVLPFENKKNKKNEFPDAVIAYCVKKWAAEHPSTLLYFVTSDKGMTLRFQIALTLSFMDVLAISWIIYLRAMRFMKVFVLLRRNQSRTISITLWTGWKTGIGTA